MKLNSFLIWRGEKVRDFELKVEFRLNGTNSGIQYRSTELPSVGKWVLKGYQADIDFGGLYTGNIHDERGRGPGEGHACCRAADRSPGSSTARNTRWSAISAIRPCCAA